jgi:Uma2 family endonuclease
MTEAEFVAWVDEDTRAEWVDGEVVIMSPVSELHSRLATWLINMMSIFVEEEDLGRVYGTEFMVRFKKLRRRRMPDLLFVAKGRTDLIKPNHFEGPPDLIIEIVSSDSESRDWREKFQEYERAGVREYWIIDPASEHAEACALGRGRKYRRIPEEAGVIKSTVIRGFWLKTA